MAAQLRAELKPKGALSNLLFDRFWSCVLRLILIARLEETGLASRQNAPETNAVVPSLCEASMPILLTVDEHQDSAAVSGTVEALEPDMFHRLALLTRYDRSASKEMYRTLGLLLLLRDGGEKSLARGIRAATLARKQLNILDFVSELNLLEGSVLSLAQRTILEATYGLALNQNELEVYCRGTGRKTYEPREYNEATVIVGRQGGKTSRIGAIIAVYEAFRHQLKRGERAYVLLIAPVMNQAQIAFNFIRSYILASPVLEAKVLKISKNQIELKNGIILACYPCSQITIRGFRVVAAILDEVGFWTDEETAANPTEQVLNALRPTMATFPNRKLIKISTPYRKDGVLWRDYQQRAELGYLVWQVTTAEMNPTISPDFLDQERLRDPESFRREYLAEFTDHIEGWIAPEVLDQCVTKSVTERPPVAGAFYAAAVDLAFKSNDSALAIVHREPDSPIVLDYAATWTGSPKAPLGYEWLCREIAIILKRYGLNTVVGDQYCAVIIQQELLKHGITYKEITFGPTTRFEIFGNAKQLLIQRNLVLLDKQEVLRTFRSLEEHKNSRGSVDVRPAYRAKDDLAVAIALAAFEVSKVDPRPFSGFFIDEHPERSRVTPSTCIRAAVCLNVPACIDAGYCLGFIGTG